MSVHRFKVGCRAIVELDQNGEERVIILHPDEHFPKPSGRYPKFRVASADRETGEVCIERINDGQRI